MAATAPTDAFLRAYDAVLAKWPAHTTHRDLVTPYGTTHVHSHGPEGGRPVVLLPGGGATSTVWYATAAALGRTHRVHAVDLVGDPGRSVPGDRPIREAGDLTGWLDALLDGLGLPSTALVGHSYGAWTAVHFALRAPSRVDRLVLLDPTNTFTGFSPRYLLRALPMLVRPTPARIRSFLEWETDGTGLDPEWTRLAALAAAFPTVRPVAGPRPAAQDLRGLRPPALLLLAEHSRAHDVREVAAVAAGLLPDMETLTLAGTTHHSLPIAVREEGLHRIAEFLSG